MKKSILSITLMAISILLSATTANAQKGLQIGLEGTPHMSWLLNDDDQNDSKFEYINTFGGSFGISGEYGFTPSLGIGLNVLYSFQGQRYKYSGAERIKKLEYVKIPVMFVYTYSCAPKVCFHGKIGPQIGILSNAKLTDKDGNDILSDHKNAYMDFDFGGVALAGIGYKLSDQLTIDALLRFDSGFTNAEDEDYQLKINDPFYVPNGNGSPSTNRPTTLNITGGITIGLRYSFSIAE